MIFENVHAFVGVFHQQRDWKTNNVGGKHQHWHKKKSTNYVFINLPKSYNLQQVFQHDQAIFLSNWSIYIF